MSCFEVGFYEFNLSNSTYQPYTKPNTALQYVHRESNHPPITTKNIPTGINKGLPSLSSDKASFDKAAPIHPPLRTHHDRQTQKQTAKQHSLVQPSIKQERQHQHRTQILSLIDKHFLKDHSLRLWAKTLRGQLRGGFYIASGQNPAGAIMA